MFNGALCSSYSNTKPYSFQSWLDRGIFMRIVTLYFSTYQSRINMHNITLFAKLQICQNDKLTRLIHCTVYHQSIRIVGIDGNAITVVLFLQPCINKEW